MISSHWLTGLGVIAFAGVTSGVLDITCTLTLSRFNGIQPRRVLQTIASGALGPKSFAGGTRSAVLGLALHFLIAFVAAAAYYAASWEFDVLIEHALLCGLLYGIAVHLFMSFVILPLSALQRPFSAKFFVTQLVIHMFFVGLPIALVIRHFA